MKCLNAKATILMSVETKMNYSLFERMVINMYWTEL